MRSAPAVQFPVGRSSWGAALSCLPAAAGLLIGLAWLRLGAAQPAQAGAVIALTSLCGLAAWFWGGWNRAGTLAWNGREWLWETTLTTLPLTQLRVRLDGQGFLLLEARTTGGGRLWFWPEQGMAPALWHGLRQAIFLPGTVEETVEEPA